MTTYTSHGLPVYDTTDLIADGTTNLRTNLNAISDTANNALSGVESRANTHADDGDAATLTSAKDHADTNDVTHENSAVSRAITDADTKYGGLPNRVTTVENRTALPYISVDYDEDMDTKREPGVYMIRTNQVAASLINSPSGLTGTMRVERGPTGLVSQTWTDLHGPDDANKNIYYRTTNAISPTPFPFGPWQSLIPEPPHTMSHDLLLEKYRQRCGGTIGTNGRGVVSIRVDHGLANFTSKILPLLRKYNLPASIALNSDTIGDAENTGVTWADVQEFALNDGIDPWNHGRDHGDATTYNALWDKIVGAKNALQGHLPECPIDKWVQPGVGGTQYDGFNEGNPVSNYWEKAAGRIIYGQHAVITGGMPAELDVLDGKPSTGFRYHNIQTGTTGAEAIIDRAILTKTGVTLFLHPSQIDTAGNSTTADIEAVFAMVAAKRDAGELMVLSMGGAQLANAGCDHRDTMTRNGDFTNNLDSWTASGFTWQDGKAVSTTAGSFLAESLNIGNFPYLAGGTREASIRVTAPTGAVVRLEVKDPDDTLKLNKAAEFTIAAGATADVSTFVQLPLSSSNVRVDAIHVSGGTVEVEHFHLWAA